MATEKVRKRKGNGGEELVERILKHIKETRSFDFGNYKRGTLSRRIERRMADRRCNNLTEYVSLLERDPKETDGLVSSMLIKVTGFFRDPEMWDVLSVKIIPQLLSEKRPAEDIRVWCAGCATGEETFSVALLLADTMGPAFQNQEVKIFGTDLDEKAIAFARRGVYSSEQVKAVAPEMRKYSQRFVSRRSASI
jgi:two-component system, chemotaxis family, CheB/CheR fusion protein